MKRDRPADADEPDADTAPAQSGEHAHSSNTRASKKANTLDSFLATRAAQRPLCLGISDVLKDADSIFLAFAASADVEQDLSTLRRWVANQGAAETLPHLPAPHHYMTSCRWVGLKPGKKGQTTQEYTMLSSHDDDGEKNGGKAVLEALSAANAASVAIVVCRWFGGTLLGPRRFQDIKDTALQALHRLRDDEALQSTMIDIRQADTTISALLKEQTAAHASTSIVQDYSDINLAKAQRLLKARNMRIKSLKALLPPMPEAPP